jgi:hypothetical protein
MNAVLLVIIISLVVGWISTGGKKSQFVRLVDVFVIAPVCMYAGSLMWDSSRSSLHNVLSLALVFIGGATLSYNLKNYLKFYERQS